jgi:hypothetical protein
VARAIKRKATGNQSNGYRANQSTNSRRPAHAGLSDYPDFSDNPDGSTTTRWAWTIAPAAGDPCPPRPPRMSGRVQRVVLGKPAWTRWVERGRAFGAQRHAALPGACCPPARRPGAAPVADPTDSWDRLSAAEHQVLLACMHGPVCLAGQPDP